MELKDNHLRITFCTAILLLAIIVHPVNCDFRLRRDCCLPDQLSGQLTLSRRMRDGFFGSHADRATFTPIYFSVDWLRGLMFGEHHVRGPEKSHVQVVADVREGVRKLYVRERITNRCWTFPLGQRLRKPCILKETTYRGSFPFSSRKSRRKRNGLVFDRSNQSPNDPWITWLKFRSLLLIDEDTCLPILDVHADDLNYFMAFHRMKAGLEGLRDVWNFERSRWIEDKCTEQEAGTYEDLMTGSGEHISSWHGPRYDSSSGSDDSSSSRDRLLQSLIEMQMLEGIRLHHTKHHHKKDFRKFKREINEIIQLEVYLYLLKQFFPRAPSKPCCGPEQWQASATKSITYNYVQTNYVGQSTTTIPRLYVDHKNGRLSADMIEYTNGSPISNTSVLALFSTGSDNHTMLSIYSTDWFKSPPECTYIQVTDVQGPMRNSCMPATAVFEHTVSLGSGPLNSVRLDVYNITGAKQGNGGQLSYSAESYVTPHECMPLMEVYKWQTPDTKVSGSITMSNTHARIVNPSQAFSVSSVCSGVTPVTIPSSQLQGTLSYVLSYSAV